MNINMNILSKEDVVKNLDGPNTRMHNDTVMSVNLVSNGEGNYTAEIIGSKGGKVKEYPITSKIPTGLAKRVRSAVKAF